MEIKVNGQKLDVVLENEKTAYDVIAAILKALDNRDALVSSVTIDGRVFSLDDAELKETNVKDIGLLDLELASKEELTASLLDESRNILHSISADLRQNGFAHAPEIRKLFDWLTETIRAINSVSLMSLAESRLLVSTVKQVADYLEGPERDEAKIPSLASIIGSLDQYVDSMKTKLSRDFTVTAERVGQEIEKCLTLLPEIAAAFQTGRDREALQNINSVINTIELACIHLQNRLPELAGDRRESVEEFSRDLNSLLSQVVTAFENGDVVLLGDLMEYELPEKLESFRSGMLDGLSGPSGS